MFQDVFVWNRSLSYSTYLNKDNYEGDRWVLGLINKNNYENDSKVICQMNISIVVDRAGK